MLIWVGVAVVVLSFVAAFLGSWLARSADSNEAAATPPPTTAEIDEAAFEDALEEILPAGSAVRAGTGVPESGKGYEGDVYIDISTADVYLFQDGDWTLVGNIRTSAAENLTGATGPAGETGATGERARRARPARPAHPGEPGTQLTLGLGAPDNETCTADGDVYIDTETVAVLRVHRRASGCSSARPTAALPRRRPSPPRSPPRADPHDIRHPAVRSAGCRRLRRLRGTPRPEWREGPSVCHNYLLNGRSGIPAGAPEPAASTLGPTAFHPRQCGQE